jgi:hypothetical protein
MLCCMLIQQLGPFPGVFPWGLQFPSSGRTPRCFHMHIPLMYINYVRTRSYVIGSGIRHHVAKATLCWLLVSHPFPPLAAWVSGSVWPLFITIHCEIQGQGSAHMRNNSYYTVRKLKMYELQNPQALWVSLLLDKAYTEPGNTAKGLTLLGIFIHLPFSCIVHVINFV